MSGRLWVKIAIPTALLQSVAQVEYIVAVADMDTLRGFLRIAGNSARGTVGNIPPVRIASSRSTPTTPRAL